MAAAVAASSSEEQARFKTTFWTVVFDAAREDPDRAGKAVETLCQCYWQPLYGFIRRTGKSIHDAQDLTQAFLAWLLENQRLRAADREQGKFRSFLLVRLKHFLSDEWKKSIAQKRGGGRWAVPIEEALAEAHLKLDANNHLTPEHSFDRQWGFTVLARAIERLRNRYIQRGKGELFDQLHSSLGSAEPSGSYGEVAARLGMSGGAVKVAVHRFRKEFGEILRNEIGRTVGSPGEIDDEIRYLLKVTSE